MSLKKVTEKFNWHLSISLSNGHPLNKLQDINLN